MSTAQYLVLAEWIIRTVMAIIVVTRKRSLYAALSWLVVIAFVPFLGMAAYFLVGENRLGRRHFQAHMAARERMKLWQNLRGHVERVVHPAIPEWAQSIASLAEAEDASQPLGGNELTLLAEAEEVTDRLVADIDAARRHCHLLYYIVQDDATGARVADALIRAAARGAKCRLLVDAAGSRTFLNGPRARRLEISGVHLAAALPVNPLRAAVARLDLRNHRKLTIIDGRTAFMGSHNVSGPIYPRKARYGAWVDATVRMTGPAVHHLQEVFLEDWLFATDERCEESDLYASAFDPTPSNVALQVLPSGPENVESPLRQVIIQALRLARKRVIFTTPYFVPDDATLASLRAAAVRGVQITLVVPRHSDHWIAQAAGRSHYGYLLDMGVYIHEFEAGLLHAKTLTVDDDFAMIGSGNLDVRSFLLNFELSLLVYDREFSARLHFLQSSYLQRSTPLTHGAWRARGHAKALADNVAKLLTPLL